MSYISKIFINNVYQGQTFGTIWNLSRIYTTPPTPFGAGYYLPMAFYTKFTWRVDVYDTETELTTTGDDWTFTTRKKASPIDPIRPDSAPDVPYDPDLRWGWDPVTQAYTWLDTTLIIGGGRYRSQLVVVGHKSIYIGDL